MSKRIYGSVSSKRKKATAEAEALRAAIDKTKPITHFSSEPEGPTPEVAADPECWSRLRQDPAFLSDPAPEPKICEKPDLDPEALLIFSSRNLCGFHIRYFLSENIPNFGCIDDSWRLNRSRILKFENVLDPDSKMLKQ